MPRFVDRAEAQRLVEAGAQVIEVLEPSQHAEVHLPGAVNIPVWELEKRARKELDPVSPALVYCYDYQ